MRRLLILCIVFCTTSATAAAATSALSARPDAPASVCCATKLISQMPQWDPAVHAWRDQDAKSPAQTGQDPDSTPQASTQASVTVTAVVLPGRLIEIASDGSMQIGGNATGPGWWTIRVASKPASMTPDIWSQATACMLQAERRSGTLCHQPAPTTPSKSS